MEQVASPIAREEESTGSGPIGALLRKLELKPTDRDFARALVEALERLQAEPGAETVRLLRELSKHPLLLDVRDERGVPLRAIVLSTWLSLGYPWALELEPDALAYLRRVEPGLPLGWLKATFGLSMLSMLANGFLGLLGLVSLAGSGRLDPWFLLFTLPFLVMTAHAVATAFASQSAERGAADARKRLFILAAAAPWATAVVAAFWFLSPAFSLVVAFFLAPAFLTSVSAGVSARALPK